MPPHISPSSNHQAQRRQVEHYSNHCARCRDKNYSSNHKDRHNYNLQQNVNTLASSYPRRKCCLQSPVTVLQFLLTSNLVKKRQRVIVAAIAKAIAEQQVIGVLITNPITHSKVKIQVIFVLKIPYPRTQKAKGDDLLKQNSSSRIPFPEGRTYTQNSTH